jgi:DNA-binding XRE family transcriptional regulator
VFREAKVSYRTYVSWQQGENNPSFPLLRKVYDVLNKKVTA